MSIKTLLTEDELKVEAIRFLMEHLNTPEFVSKEDETTIRYDTMGHIMVQFTKSILKKIEIDEVDGEKLEQFKQDWKGVIEPKEDEMIELGGILIENSNLPDFNGDLIKLPTVSWSHKSRPITENYDSTKVVGEAMLYTNDKDEVLMDCKVLRSKYFDGMTFGIGGVVDKMEDNRILGYTIKEVSLISNI